MYISNTPELYLYGNNFDLACICIRTRVDLYIEAENKRRNYCFSGKNQFIFQLYPLMHEIHF